MGSTISKTVNIIDLPIDADISSEDYIIIQNETRTFRVQIKDMILTKDNVTFGQEINDIYDRVGQLQVVISALQTQITDLQSQLTQSQQENANITSTANTTITNLQSQIDNLTNRTRDLGSSIDATDKNVSSLQSVDIAYDSRIKTNADNIAVINNRLNIPQ